MLIIEPRMVNNFWARSPISSKHMSFRCLLLEPHLIRHHSYIGVLLRLVTELGLLIYITPKSNVNRCFQAQKETSSKTRLPLISYRHRKCSPSRLRKNKRWLLSLKHELMKHDSVMCQLQSMLPVCFSQHQTCAGQIQCISIRLTGKTSSCKYLWTQETLSNLCMWPYCGHFQLLSQFWPLDQLRMNCLIQLAIVMNHAYCPFTFQYQS